MHIEDVQISESVFEVLRSAAPSSPWLEILLLRRRMMGEGIVHSGMSQVILWHSSDNQVSSTNLHIAALQQSQLFDYFERVFDYPNWTRVFLVCKVDGSNSATVTTDPTGLPESNYLSGFDDPFWNYLDEHRTELEAFGQRYYGAAKGGLFGS